MKTIKLGVFFAVIFSFLMTSCSSDDDNVIADRDLAVQFKVMATEQVNVKSAIVQIGPNQTIDYNVEGQSWASESQIINTSSKYIRLASTADIHDQDSELMVQILVDGKILAADTVKVTPGSTNMVAKTALNFNEF